MEVSILGNKMRVELIVLCLIIGGFISCNVFCSCAGGVREGLQVIGAAVDYTMSSSTKNGVTSKKIFDKLETNSLVSPEPVPNEKMAIFSDNTFSPECCPAAYSSSNGCVCATPEQVDFIARRGQEEHVGPI